MKDRFDDKRKMGAAVLQTVNSSRNKAVWSPNPPAETPLPMFNDKVDELAEVQELLGNRDTSGAGNATDSKDTAETALEDAALVMSGKLFVYYDSLAKFYHKAGNDALSAKASGIAQKYRFRKSDFTKLRDGALLERTLSVFVGAAVLATAPQAGWGDGLSDALNAALRDGTVEAGGGVPPVTTGDKLITPERAKITTPKIVDLGASRTAYATWVTAPQDAIGKRKILNQQTTPMLIDEQDSVLDALDRLIEHFRGTDEGDRFIGEYFTARMVRNTGSHSAPETPPAPAPAK